MDVNRCQGCDEPLPPSKGGVPRKWCSERCRKSTLYSATCTRCGARDNGSEGRRDGDWLCGDCKHDEQYAERNKRIIELWEAGQTAPEIGAELGMEAGAVTSWINTIRQRTGAPISLHRRRDRELWPEIQRLWAEGLTARAIGERLGASKENISWQIRTMRLRGIDVAERGYDWKRRAAA